jgi:hypothetical protein
MPEYLVTAEIAASISAANKEEARGRFFELVGSGPYSIDALSVEVKL